MSADFFFYALNDIHDRYVEEALHYRVPAKRVIRPILRRLAAACFAIIIGFSAVISVNAEAREIVFGWIRDHWETFIRYYYESPFQDSDQEDSGESTPRAYELTLIPEGYTLLNYNDQPDKTSFVYANYEANQIMYFEYILPNDVLDVYYSLETHTHHWITVRGVEAEVYLPSNPTTDDAIIIWYEDNIMMSIRGWFSQEELIELAESVTEVPYSPGSSEE